MRCTSHTFLVTRQEISGVRSRAGPREMNRCQLLLPLDGGGWRTPATILSARLPCPDLAVCQMSILMMLWRGPGVHRGDFSQVRAISPSIMIDLDVAEILIRVLISARFARRREWY